MEPFETFEQWVRETLASLYDPTYRPPAPLSAMLGCGGDDGSEAVQLALIRAIEELKPPPVVPPTARSRRLYELLLYRYVQNLTQEEVADRLGITARHLRREQPEAAHVLALRLWERRGEAIVSAAGVDVTETADWLSQLRDELISLQRNAPGALAEVDKVLRRAIELGGQLAGQHPVTFDLADVTPDLVAAIHPAALRQIVIAAIRQLNEQMASGTIDLCAERLGEQVRISISGFPTIGDDLPHGELIREIVATQGGSVEIGVDDERITFSVTLPSVDRVVLVVDDNADLVHVFQRYVVGTRYRIIHVSEGRWVFEAVERSVPDLIVLDVMLPDADGWELLANLHEHPLTRSVPVVVCSVVREIELALALGATHYLAKPVQRDQFIQALDQAFSQAPAGSSRSPANSAAAY
jgi:CheY-like chemotaxis protein